MNHSRFAALLAAAALAIFLTACGGGSDDGGDAAAETSTPAAAEGAAPTGGGAEAGDAVAAPGSMYKVGDTVHVGWVLTDELAPTLESGEPQAIAGKDLAVTVESIEEGSIDDWADLGLSAAEEENTPVYVTTKFEALEELGSSGTDSPASELAAYAGEELLTPQIFVGTFEPCATEPTPPSKFGAGDSYESCQAYLLPDGVSITDLRWSSGPSKEGEFSPYDEKPVVWEAG
ncbi:MAG TPA: hypothetical protein VFX45_00690 [Solirubrobacterales bacterium]|nr:hypothetical protein [Solirubrobacterales bacterium]